MCLATQVQEAVGVLLMYISYVQCATDAIAWGMLPSVQQTFNLRSYYES